MELDDLSQSGIRRIADFSPYLDQLAGVAQDMGLRQRSSLVQLEQNLHQHWSDRHPEGSFFDTSTVQVPAGLSGITAPPIPRAFARALRD